MLRLDFSDCRLEVGLLAEKLQVAQGRYDLAQLRDQRFSRASVQCRAARDVIGRQASNRALDGRNIIGHGIDGTMLTDRLARSLTPPTVRLRTAEARAPAVSSSLWLRTEILTRCRIDRAIQRQMLHDCSTRPQSANNR